MTMQTSKETEKIFETIFEGFVDGLIIIDPAKKRFRLVNKTICLMLGYSKKELLNLPVLEIYPLEGAVDVCDRARDQNTEKGVVTDIPMKRKNGSIFYADVYSSSILLNGKNHSLRVFKYVSERKRREKRAETDFLDLEEKEKIIQYKNIAFQELLKEVEVARKEVESCIHENINQIIMPIVKRCKIKGGASRKFLDLIEKNLQEITTSFGYRVSDKSFNLTPKEIEICNLVKTGLTTKEISRLLNISSLTIDKHRKNIRKKLGLVSKNINLVSFLQSF